MKTTFLLKPILAASIFIAPTRKRAAKKIDSMLCKLFMSHDFTQNGKIKEKAYQMTSAMLNRAIHNLNRGIIKPKAAYRMAGILFRTPGREKVKKFEEQHGASPPQFITLSPTQKCNLNCTGCYAGSNSRSAATLDYPIVDKIIGEVRNLFDKRFIVISGGEPFMYQSRGRTLFDIFKKYQDMFFLVYTNGILINKTRARELAKLGNVLPAVSVEGNMDETDERRGRGIHDKIVAACYNMRDAGVPFAISVTATKKNVHLLLQDEFYGYYFDKLGASFMWQFQFMPIGRGKDNFDLMISPRERVLLYEKWKELLKNKYPVADFWNSGVVSGGCIAYGRKNGYFYIDWNGNITPCVFVPYYVDNIMELYKKGKNLGDALTSDFMKRGRKWQEEYQSCRHENTHCENVLMPCSIRDHYKNFRKNILTSDAKPEDKYAEYALTDTDYYNKLVAFDDELEKLTTPVVAKDYCN